MEVLDPEPASDVSDAVQTGQVGYQVTSIQIQPSIDALELDHGTEVGDRIPVKDNISLDMGTAGIIDGK